jgi:hypothetical protein
LAQKALSASTSQAARPQLQGCKMAVGVKSLVQIGTFIHTLFKKVCKTLGDGVASGEWLCCQAVLAAHKHGLWAAKPAWHLIHAHSAPPPQRFCKPASGE